MRKNETIELTIDDLTTTGSGIGRKDGMAVFVSAALPGETIRAKIIKVKKSYAIGKLEEILVPSPLRVKPPCPYFGKCGGCTLQELTYAGQLTYKHEHVMDCFERIAHLPVDVSFPLPSRSEYHYRNKASFALHQRADGGVDIGFYALHSHRVVDIDNCLLQHDLLKLIMSQVRVWITKSDVSIYDERTDEGLLRHIIVRTDTRGNYMLVLVINGEEIPAQERLMQLLTMALPQVTSVVLNVNKKRGNTILGDRNIVLKGSGWLYTMIGDMQFRIGPNSFLQVNHGQTEVLYHQLLRQLGLGRGERVLDLFCGIGTISLMAARHALHVTGIEYVREAAENASFNAQMNDIGNADFIAGDADELTKRVLEEEGADVVIVNPPRRGLSESLIRTIAHARPRAVGYVSCDPATLARDAQIFDQLGYHSSFAQPVDMFPQTTHVETVVVLSQ